MSLAMQQNLDDAALDSMNFLNEIVLRFPQAISFAPGRPLEDHFEVAGALSEIDRFVAYEQQRSKKSRHEVFNFLGQYGRTNGIIHDLISQHLAIDEQIHVTPAAVVVTVGCQEGMAMLLMGLFQPDDVLLVGDPAYVGITGTARVLGIEMAPVPIVAGDVPLDKLQAVLESLRSQGKRPRGLYLIPDFNNPQGSTMSLANRKELLHMSAAQDVLIFEDNPYGMFAYDQEPMPTLKSLDTQQRVVYLGTFAKTLFPGLRLGYLVADQQVGHGEGLTLLADQLSKVKSFLTVNTSPLLQAIAGGILLKNEGSLRAVVAPKIACYKTNRDAMVQALASQAEAQGLSDHLTWNQPAGGFFLTVQLPFRFAEEDVLELAAHFDVIVCPMSLFSLRLGYERQIRLSFSYVNPEQIRLGVKQLLAYVSQRLSSH